MGRRAGLSVAMHPFSRPPTAPPRPALPPTRRQTGRRRRGRKPNGALPAAEQPVFLTAQDVVPDEEETETESEPEPASEEEEEGGGGARRLPKRAKRVRVEEEMDSVPTATARVMPCRAVSATGRRVRVWWLAEEGPKEGAMHLATVVAYNRRTGGCRLPRCVCGRVLGRLLSESSL